MESKSKLLILLVLFSLGLLALPAGNAYAGGAHFHHFDDDDHCDDDDDFQDDDDDYDDDDDSNDDDDDDEDDACLGSEIVFSAATLSGFNVFSCQDYIGGVDIQGKAAVAKNASFINFSVGQLDPGDDALVVGRNLYLRQGTVHGNGVYGLYADINQTVNFQSGGNLVNDTPILFGDVCDTLKGGSLDLATIPANGTTYITGWHGIFFGGSNPLLNVFYVSATDLSNGVFIRISAPAGSKVLINIVGQGMLTLSNLAFDLVGIDRQDIVFNAPWISSATITNISFQGSLLAPVADVEFFNGNFEGQLVAGNLEGSGEFHHYPFDGEISYCYELPSISIHQPNLIQKVPSAKSIKAQGVFEH